MTTVLATKGEANRTVGQRRSSGPFRRKSSEERTSQPETHHETKLKDGKGKEGLL